MHKGKSMSVTDELVLMCAEQLGSLIFWGMWMVVFVVFIVAAPLIHSARHPYRVVISITVLLAAYRMARDLFMGKIQRFRRFAGPMIRFKLQESIADLKTKLAAREHPKPEH